MIRLDKQDEAAKIDLTKRLDLSKPATVHVNLRWSSREQAAPAKSGGGWRDWFGGTGETKVEVPDLDLGCLYELADGVAGSQPNKGVIQPLGKLYGSPKGYPYIHLDKDDRSGGGDGENLILTDVSKLKRVVLYSYIYSGSKNFSSVAAKVTLKTSTGEHIEIDLNNPEGQTFVALAHISYENGQLVVRKEERYFGGHYGKSGHQLCDEHYGNFNFPWVTASKD